MKQLKNPRKLIQYHFQLPSNFNLLAMFIVIISCQLICNPGIKFLADSLKYLTNVQSVRLCFAKYNLIKILERIIIII